MDFNVYCTYIPLAHMIPVAVEAERLGYSGVSFPDHVFYPTSLASPYPYTADGRLPWDEDSEWADPLAVAAALAATTTTLKLMTGILVLPLRHPLLVAKAVATIEALAPKRVVLGVGAGWMKDEFVALGEDFHTRGRRMDEQIDVMRKVWTGQPTAFEGEFYQFDELVMRPAPSSSIPIFIGGGSDAAIRRAALCGDGFLPPLTGVSKARDVIGRVHEMRSEFGRSELPFEVVGSAFTLRDRSEISELKAAGVTGVRVHPFAHFSDKEGANPGPMSLDERLSRLERFANEFLYPVLE